MEYEVIITQTALRDLRKIRAYIAKDNPPAAESFVSKLLNKAESLNTFYGRGGYVKERPGARFALVYPYLVIYRIDERSRAVVVLRFWHGARERRRMRLPPP